MSKEEEDDKNKGNGVDVRRRFAEEGRSARNLLIWSVPLDLDVREPGFQTLKHRKPPTSPRSSSKLSSVDSDRFVTTKRSAVVLRTGKTRIRSVSAGRDPKLDLKARYWAFLFENLRRAVDEIHETCSTDESIAECKEAIMVLDNYTKDFHSLIEWLNLKRDFDSTPPRSRPTSLAWQMRRPSSKSNLLSVAFEEIMKPSPVRTLKFDEEQQVMLTSLGTQTDTVPSSSTVSIEPLVPITNSNSCNSQTKVSSAVPMTESLLASTVVASTPVPVAKTSKAMPTNVLTTTNTSKTVVTTHLIDVVPKTKVNSKLYAASLGANSLFQPNQKSSSTRSSAIKSERKVVPVHSKPMVTSASPTAKVLSPVSRKPAPIASPSTKSATSHQSAVARSGSMSSVSSTSSNSQSWADKVRGTPPSSSSANTSTLSSVQEKKASIAEGDDVDSDGWETVQRVRSKSKLSPPKVIGSPRGKDRSNSIAGFDMYCDKESTSKVCADKQPQSEPLRSGRPSSSVQSARKVFTTSSSSAASRMRSQPTPARSLPALHILKSENFLASKCGAGQMKQKAERTLNRNSVSAKSDSTKAKVSTVSSSSKNKIELKSVTSNIETNEKKISLASDAKKSNRIEVDNKKNLADMENLADPINETNDRATDEPPVAQTSTLLIETITEQPFTSEDEGSILSPPLPDDDGTLSETTTTEDEMSFPRGMLWGDYMDCLDAEVRPPGRVIQIHEKLSSPSRKRPLSESIRRHEEKQAKAQEQRERFLEEKAQRGKEISKKVEEKRLWKEEIVQQRRLEMERKLQRAEEKRRMQLQMIVRKAHDEEEKVNEIAFINTLEAQNKRHDVLSRIQGHEARLQDIQGERQRRQEEKAAKEAAAEERRRALEAERQAKLLEMQEKRKQKEYKIEQHQQEREKERQEVAREKARDREVRMSALQAAHQATMEELQKKIQQKQEESARRHDENIEHIRLKALELSILRVSSAADDAPRLVPYETKKLCTLCNVLIASEVYLLSHLRGKKHQLAIRDKHQGLDPSLEETESYNLKHVINAPADNVDPQIAFDRERQKTLKKRCKKLRHRMTTKGSDFENSKAKSKSSSFDSANGLKVQRFVKDMTRCLHNSGSGPWPMNLVTSLDRSFGELTRFVTKKGQTAAGLQSDQSAFRSVAGFNVLTEILGVIPKGTKELPTVLPSKTLVNACNVYRLVCQSNAESCAYILSSNRLTGLLDFLVHRLNLLIPDNCDHLFIGNGGNIITSLPVDNVAKSLLQLISAICSTLSDDVTSLRNKVSSSNEDSTFVTWIQDVISYTVSLGIVDKLSQYFSNVRGPIDDDLAVSEFIEQGMDFLLLLTKLLACSTYGTNKIFERSKMVTEDTTQLVATLQITELVGSVSLLYGMLLHTGALSRGQTPPPQINQSTMTVTTSAVSMLNHFAFLDLQMFQFVVGGEGISLEFRHIVSYLLWYCSHWTNAELLHELILIVGYFAVLNADNQTVIQSGHMPTVLQQLCLLPFQYFSNPALVDILFPTIIACCFNNTQNSAILEQELSSDLLAHYVEEKTLDVSDPRPQKKSKESSVVGTAAADFHKWSLEERFPRSHWNEAQKFFLSPK